MDSSISGSLLPAVCYLKHVVVLSGDHSASNVVKESVAEAKCKITIGDLDKALLDAKAKC